jgi:hypothetical protein
MDSSAGICRGVTGYLYLFPRLGRRSPVCGMLSRVAVEVLIGLRDWG